MELWKPIKNYEGLYEISSFGRVRSLERIAKWKNGHRLVRERFRVPCNDTYGYQHVTLSKGNKQATIKIHRLVCEHFLVNHSGLSQINHLDEDKRNNKSENLEWCTVKHNSRHSAKKLTAQSAELVKRLRATGWTGKAIAIQMGISQATVSSIIHGKSWG